MENEKVHVVNLGDSRTTIRFRSSDLSDSSGLSEWWTKSHTPKKEWTRVSRAGGLISKGRLRGELAVSRALGDISFKYRGKGVDKIYDPRDAPLSALPDVTTFSRGEIDTIIIASDGLYEKITPNKLWKIYDSLPSDGNRAELLVYESLRRGSTDNTSVIVLRFSNAE